MIKLVLILQKVACNDSLIVVAMIYISVLQLSGG